jgi:hypothetical protein
MKTLTFIVALAVLIPAMVYSITAQIHWAAIILAAINIGVLIRWVFFGTPGNPHPNPHNTPSSDPTQFGGY